MILVDTCVLIDISASDPRWADWSAEQLATWTVRGALMTNPVIFAEWCSDFPTLEAAAAAVDDFGLTWAELPTSALYLASRAHMLYLRRGGTRPIVLPDFLIGAQAAAEGWPLLTRDRRRFDAYFNRLEIVSPD